MSGTRRSVCPRCGGERDCHIRGAFEHRESDERAPVWQDTTYRILECAGCHAIFFEEDSVFSEDCDYYEDPHTGEYIDQTPHTIRQYPKQKTYTVPDWLQKVVDLDDLLGDIFEEMYDALENDRRIAAAICARTAFERATLLLGVDPSRHQSFKRKLEWLAQEGYLTSRDMSQLDVLVQAGNAAAHRGWKPDKNTMDYVLEVLKAFLYRNLVMAPAASELRNNIPRREE